MLDLGVCLGGFLPHEVGELGEAADLEALLGRPFDDYPTTEEFFARFSSPCSRRDEVVELPKSRILFGRADAFIASRVPDGVGENFQRIFASAWHDYLPAVVLPCSEAQRL